jgi:hypothetical protein
VLDRRCRKLRLRRRGIDATVRQDAPEHEHEAAFAAAAATGYVSLSNRVDALVRAGEPHDNKLAFPPEILEQPGPLDPTSGGPCAATR